MERMSDLDFILSLNPKQISTLMDFNIKDYLIGIMKDTNGMDHMLQIRINKEKEYYYEWLNNKWNHAHI